MKNKVVLIKAHFVTEYEELLHKVPSGQYEKGTSKSKIDSERLASDLQESINDLNAVLLGCSMELKR